MKQDIILGAYGWRHAHWLNTFYPEDLPVAKPEDWRLTYYSNQFNAVLVPFDYWQTNDSVDCGDWLDAVHEGFQFFVECHVNMLDFISMAELSAQLKKLQPQLSALVFLDGKQQISASVNSQFDALATSLKLEVFGSGNTSGVTLDAIQRNIWSIGRYCPSSFAFIEDNLSDLRSAKKLVEDFLLQLESQPATIIIHHPQLQASDLSKLRSMLEIMGY